MLRRGDKVRVTKDLPGVPAGTVGIVTMYAGIDWLRYRVRFENGDEVGGLDEKCLDKVGRYGTGERPVAHLPWRDQVT